MQFLYHIDMNDVYRHVQKSSKARKLKSRGKFSEKVARLGQAWNLEGALTLGRA